MKKFLWIVVLGLLWCGTANANDCIKGNCTNGQGTMEWSNGDQYVGEWKDGKTHGVGTLTWSDGSKYAGEWRNGLENGKGRLTWSDGTIYIGERYNSKAEGKGTLILTNGDKYVGEWKNDKKHGIGKMFYNTGYSFKARWENDILVEKISKDQVNNIEDIWHTTDKSTIKYKYIFNYYDKLPKIFKKKDLTIFKELKFIKKAENINFFHRVSNNQNDKSSSIKTISGDVYIFKAIYEENYGHDGIRFMVNADFKSFKKAEKVALKYARYIGQLPAFLREKGFRHIYIHPQDRRWFATRSKNIFTIYTGERKSAHYIVATLIHEAAHLATDLSLVNDPLWKKAVNADKKYITDYARTNKWEDAAETILFWIGLRCGKKVSNNFKKKVVEAIPNRIKYLDEQNYDTYPLVCK